MSSIVSHLHKVAVCLRILWVDGQIVTQVGFRYGACVHGPHWSYTCGCACWLSAGDRSEYLDDANKVPQTTDKLVFAGA